MAILFFGKHFGENVHWSKNVYQIDWRESLTNYKTMVFDYFQQEYEIECYAGTYDTSKLSDVITDYNIKGYKLAAPAHTRHLSRHGCVISAFEALFESDKVYDMVLLTRFDLKFMVPFSEVEIKPDQINVVSRLEHEHLVCDNLYIFPFSLAKKIYAMFVAHGCKVSYHFLLAHLKRIAQVHFLLDQGRLVEDLDFYKIVRNIDPGLTQNLQNKLKMLIKRRVVRRSYA